MKLCNPGAVIAAPPLTGPAGEIAALIERLPGVVSHTHWLLGDPETVDGAEYHFRDDTIGHVHLDGSVHLPIDALASPLVQAGLATYAPWSKRWVMLSARDDLPFADALWLFELACARVAGVAQAELIDRIRNRTIPTDEACKHRL